MIGQSKDSDEELHTICMDTAERERRAPLRIGVWRTDLNMISVEEEEEEVMNEGKQNNKKKKENGTRSEPRECGFQSFHRVN
jgi:hypothetical protein